ncbi:MAG: hypothetical protein EOO75_08145, partial [Myxococcales bacterium]
MSFLVAPRRMRKEFTIALVVVGAALQGVAMLASGQAAGSVVKQAGVVDLVGGARRLSALAAPREATASTLRASLTAVDSEVKKAPPGEGDLEKAPAGGDGEADTTDSPDPSQGKATPSGDVCPANMVLVEGEYCPEVEHTCSKWMETTGRYKNYRCAEYTGAKCLSKQRVHKKFCMDRDEYSPVVGELPSARSSWTDASKTCGAMGKRVCLESEWQFACEGEQMQPYPYGWKRDADACNADRVDIYERDGSLRDLRVGAADKPRCVSPFGVHNLSGNLEEWTTIDASAGSAAPRPAMKGAFWQPSRNHCRAAQTAHDRFYNGAETGFRCCSDTAAVRNRSPRRSGG